MGFFSKIAGFFGKKKTKYSPAAPRPLARHPTQKKTDTYAWDAGLPCKNPNCKSHGKPHPNCKCYGSPSGRPSDTPYAEGGEVRCVCSDCKPHEKGCEYYAEGGDAQSEDLGIVPDPHAGQPAQQDDLGIVPDNGSDLGIVPDTSNDPKYATTGQHILGGAEAVGRGLAGPLFTGAEKLADAAGVPGLSNEDITGRQNELGLTGTAIEGATTLGSMALGVGEAGMIAKGLEALPALKAANESGLIAKAGANAIKGFIQTATMTTGDQLSDYMLGKNSDPSEAAAAIGMSGLLGGVFGGVGGAASQLLEKESGALAGRMNGILAGVSWSNMADEVKESMPIGQYAKGIGLGPNGVAGARFGAKIGDALASHAVGHLIGVSDMKSGYQENGVPGAILGFAKGELEGAIIKKLSTKVAVPMLMKVLGSGTFTKIAEGINQAGKMNSATQSALRGVDNLFKAGTRSGVNEWANERDKNKANELISNGSIQSQMQAQDQASSPGFAEGGLVEKSSSHNPSKNVSKTMTTNMTMGKTNTKSNPSTIHPPSKDVERILHTPVLQGTDFMATHYPELAMTMGIAKGRISNYLNSLRPTPHPSKLPFDAEPSQAQQKKAYDKALSLAVQPLSILNHIKEGSLTPEDMTHFTQMYPEVYQSLQKKITQKVVDSQLSGEMPKYSVRQALSLFMGTPMASTFTPQNIQAAQAVFMQQKAGQQAAAQQSSKPKKNTSKMGEMSKSLQTESQAPQARQQNS